MEHTGNWYNELRGAQPKTSFQLWFTDLQSKKRQLERMEKQLSDSMLSSKSKKNLALVEQSC